MAMACSWPPKAVGGGDIRRSQFGTAACLLVTKLLCGENYQPIEQLQEIKQDHKQITRKHRHNVG